MTAYETNIVSFVSPSVTIDLDEIVMFSEHKDTLADNPISYTKITFRCGGTVNIKTSYKDFKEIMEKLNSKTKKR